MSISLHQEAKERMKQAPRNELEGEAVWHWLNNPAMQWGYMEKQIEQQATKQEI